MLLSEGDNLTSSQAAPEETFLHQVIGEKAQCLKRQVWTKNGCWAHHHLFKELIEYLQNSSKTSNNYPGNPRRGDRTNILVIVT